MITKNNTENMQRVRLSKQQKRMWFLEHVTNKQGAYNVTVAFRIKGDLCVDSLKIAYDCVIKRHQQLRAAFIESQDDLTMVLRSECHLSFDCMDLKSYTDSDISTKFSDILRDISRYKFDLSQAPLFLVKVIEVGDSDYRLINTFHHIIIDGWSFKRFYKDLSNFYNQITNSKKPNLPQQPAQYTDYIDSLHGRSESKVNIDKEFWSNYLEPLEYAELPANIYLKEESSCIDQYKSKSKITYIEKDLLDKFEALALKLNVTLYSALLSVYAIIFAHFTGKNRFYIGSPVANRHDISYEDIIGLFVNTLPIKIEINEAESFESNIKSISNSALQCFMHQELPFDEIVALTETVSSPNKNPLFNTMFVLQDDFSRDFQISELEVEMLDIEVDNNRFDFETTFWKTDNGLKWRIIYNTDMYSEKFVNEFVERFNSLLKDIIKTPQSSINYRGWLKSQDIIRILSMGQGEKRAFALDSDCNIVHLLNETIKKYPNNIAVTCEGIDITYQIFSEKICKYKAYLQNNLKGSRQLNVAVALPRSTHLIIAILAVISSGHTLVPVNPFDPSVRIKHILTNANVAAIVADDALMSIDLINDLDIIKLKTPSEIKSNQQKSVSLYQNNIKHDDLIYIIHTSGTTGLPKGVMVTHRNFYHTLTNLYNSYDFSNKDIFGCVSAFTFDIFYFEALVMFVCGGTTRLITKNELLSIDAMQNILKSITAMQAVPSLMNQFVKVLELSKISKLQHFKFVTTGGETVPPTLFNKLKTIFPNAQLSITYGPTEGTIICCKYLPDREGRLALPVIGKPLPNTEIRICDSQLNPVPLYVSGEICISGPGVTCGYINQTDLTEDKFILIKGKRYYRTGDLVRWLDDGVIEYLGRKDNQVKVRGYRIELDAINNTILAYPKIAQAVTTIHGAASQRSQLISYACLDNDTFRSSSLRLSYDRVQNWKSLFNQTHSDVDADAALSHDFTGWKSAIFGDDIPLNEMEEWLKGCKNAIFSSIADDKLRLKKLKILEIGCGTGLLVFELSCYAQEYYATDFSAPILHTLNKRLKQKKINNVFLQQCAAHEVASYYNKDFDLIIINSVSQYFPNIKYFENVVTSIAGRMKNDAVLFIGDVRNFRRLDILNAKILSQNTDIHSKSRHEREYALAQKTQSEQELCLDPRYFYHKFNNYVVCASPRIDNYNNELSRYRYNVSLKKILSSSELIKWLKYDNNFNADLVLREVAKNGYIAINKIFDNDINSDLEVYSNLIEATIVTNKDNSQQDNCIFSSRHNLLRWVQQQNLNIDFYYHIDDLSTTYSVVIYNDAKYKNIKMPSYFSSEAVLVNDPLKSMVKQSEKKLLKSYLANKLAPYMLPDHIEIIDNMPVTAHGKIDRSKLDSGYVFSSKEYSDKKLSATEKKLIESLEQTLGVTAVNILDDFFEVGGTSLLAIQWAIELRKHDITISPQDIFKHRKLYDLASYIDNAADKSGNITISRKSKTYRHFSHNEQSAHIDVHESHVLLFGATGFLGSHVLYELLEAGFTTITCIVRATPGHSAYERLEQCFYNYFGKQLPSSVKVAAGDVSSFRFGLSHAIWNDLSEHCNIVINCAANVRHVAHADEVFSVNTYGVAEILEFLQSGIKKYLFHTSTIGVKGINISAEQEYFSEKDLDIAQTHTEDYSRSKFNAEKMLSDYIKNDNFAKIFRIGTIAPHSTKGYFQRNIEEHFLTRFIRSVIACKAAPLWNQRVLTLTPVDVIAKAIVAIMLSGDSTTSVYHIETNQVTDYAQLAKFLQAYGYDIDIVHPDIFNAIITNLIKTNSQIKPELTGIIQLIDAPNNKNIKLNSHLTEHILSDISFSYPSYTQQYITKFIEHCINCNYIHKPGCAAKQLEESLCVD